MATRAEQRAEVNQRLIDAGTKLLANTPIDVTKHLKVAAVAAEAGLSNGAFYSHFDSQEQFYKKLLRHVAEGERRMAINETIQAVTGAIEDDLNFDDVVRRGARENFRSILASVDFKLVIASWHMARDHDEELRDALAETYQTANKIYSGVYAGVMSHFGLRFTDPAMTVDRLAVILNAAVEGLVLRAGIDPDGAEIEDGTTDLFGEMVLAIIRGLTDSDDPE